MAISFSRVGVTIAMHTTVSSSPGGTDGWWPTLRSLLVFGVATGLVAYLGSLVTRSSVESAWFENLDKPVFYPPSFLFGLVWTILYVMIAVAGWLAWRNGGRARTTVPWIIQLILNLGWTLLFFGAQEPLWALISIVVLLGVTIWTAAVMWPHSRVATYLFVPYILWVGFAAVLNGAIVALN